MSLRSFLSTVRLFYIRKPRFLRSAQERGKCISAPSSFLHLAVLITVILVIGLITAIITLSHFHPMRLSLCWHAMCCKGRICARVFVKIRQPSISKRTSKRQIWQEQLFNFFKLPRLSHPPSRSSTLHVGKKKKNNWQRMEQKKKWNCTRARNQLGTKGGSFAVCSYEPLLMCVYVCGGFFPTKMCCVVV